jgi:hypothetical protein
MGPQAWAPRHVSASTSNIWRGIRHERANKWHKLRLVDDDPVITQAEALGSCSRRRRRERAPASRGGT